MTRMRIAVTALAFLIAGPAVAQQSVSPIATSQPTPAALRAALAGTWKGALGYRDYQSNTLFELPVTTTITTVPDTVTQIRTSIFDEGAGQQPVWITTISLDNPAAATVTSTSFRKGRTPELETETLVLERYASQTDWVIVYSQTGTDDDKPARIRVTETRKGAELLSVKEVRPVKGDAPWAFRNQMRLTRLSD